MTGETHFQRDSIFRRTTAFLSRAQLPGDALLLIYFAVFSRQYLSWFTDDNLIAWVFSALAGIAFISLYIAGRPSEEEIEGNPQATLPFWLIAVLPLVFVYGMRVAFPDGSFDVLNYRIFHAERAIRGLLYLPGEFFPTPAPYNPAPDMVTGLFRHALGYRLGTIVNLLVMIWVAQITDKLLRPFLGNAWLRAGGVLLAVCAEHMLFEINNYMADLLALPLLLEATYLALLSSPPRNAGASLETRTLLRIALLLGMSVAFKLTNAGSALPVVLLCAYYAVTRPLNLGRVGLRAKQLAATTLVCGAAFLAPLLPFSLYIYRETGSPVFPVFNGIFQSVNWPAHSIWDPRWGPVDWWEKLLWPIVISFKPERLSELSVYSGRISLGFIVAIIGFVVWRRDRRVRDLFLLLVAAAIFWSLSTGYIRYALYVEVMSAIVVLACAAKLLEQTRKRRVALAMGSLLSAGLAFQSCLAAYFVSQQEWSQRPTVFAMPGPYFKEARHLFRDYSLRPFIETETLKRFDQVDVWIGSSIKTSAITIMVRPDVPVIGVRHYEYIANPESRERFNQTLQLVSGKRMFSLTFDEELEATKATLVERGFAVGEIVQVDIPYYSKLGRIKAWLIEVNRAAESETGPVENAAPEPQAALADSAYQAQILPTDLPQEMKASEQKTLLLTVRNIGTGVWPSRVKKGWMRVVTIGNRWLNADGKRVVNELDGRTALPDDLQPGDERQLALTISAPKAPGNYLLEIDMVHEGVTWFKDKGSEPLRIALRVK